MPSKTHIAYQDSLSKWFRKHANETDIRDQLERYADASTREGPRRTGIGLQLLVQRSRDPHRGPHGAAD